MIIAANCNDDNGPVNGNGTDCEPDSGFIQLTTPTGDETFAVGQKVTVKWKIDRGQVDGVVLGVSIDGGITFIDIVPKAVMAEATPQYQCMSYEWTIGSEANAIAYEATNSVLLRVEWYQDRTFSWDVSEAFTINQ
jgi:hypothetical protein